MFADDKQIYRSCSLDKLADSIDKINTDLKAVSKWVLENRLKLNPNKCQSIIIYRKSLDTSNVPPVLVDDMPIPYVGKIKNLGIVLNPTLTWNDEVNSVVKRVYGVLSTLWSSAYYTPQSTRLALVKSLVAPLFLYSDMITGLLDSDCRHKINLAYNTCIRYIYNLKKYDHVSMYRDSVFGCSMESYLKFRMCTYIFKLIKNQSPSYLFKKLKSMKSVRVRGLIQPVSRTLHSSRLFFVYAISVSNSLPGFVRGLGGLAEFRRHAFIYFRNSQVG